MIIQQVVILILHLLLLYAISKIYILRKDLDNLSNKMLLLNIFLVVNSTILFFIFIFTPKKNFELWNIFFTFAIIIYTFITVFIYRNIKSLCISYTSAEELRNKFNAIKKLLSEIENELRKN